MTSIVIALDDQLDDCEAAELEGVCARAMLAFAHTRDDAPGTPSRQTLALRRSTIDLRDRVMHDDGKPLDLTIFD